MSAGRRIARRCALLLACQLLAASGLRTRPATAQGSRGRVLRAALERGDAEDALNLFGVRHPSHSLGRTPKQDAIAEAETREGHVSEEEATEVNLFFKRERLVGNRTSGEPVGQFIYDACPMQRKSAVVGFAIYLVAWCAVACLFWLWKWTRQELEDPTRSSDRNSQWDRARFHLMTMIIWTHWLGKWGLNHSRAGWAFLSWAFTFHIIGFVFLSGVFTQGYAQHAAARGASGAQRLALRCLDVFLVYVIFSWLRGLVDLSLVAPRPHFGTVIVTVFKGTFMFHQAPWYLAALIIWRLSALLLWWVPAIVVASLVVAAICPYNALASVRDPFAVREVMHYLPYFIMGLVCGRKRLEKAFSYMGTFTPWIGAVVLVAFAIIIWFPLGWLYDDPSIRWMIIKKEVPPKSAGGLLTMLALYIAKLISTLAALSLFSTACGIKAVDRVCEAIGKRSMTVYMVHMVFIMVPGDAFCLDRYFASAAELHGMLMAVILFILAVAANLLCGSAFTAWLFQPAVEPLATVGLLSMQKRKASTPPALGQGRLRTT